MELILTDERYNDVRRLTFSNADFDIGGENDFEITLPLEDLSRILNSAAVCMRRAANAAA